MEKVVGTGRAEKIAGSEKNDLIFGEGGNDVIEGGQGGDRIHGGGGDDILYGNEGNDVVFGASTQGGVADLDKLSIFEDVKGTVTFLGESAGFKNALGMYKIADDGTIYDVDVLFANASLKGSGGDLVSGKSAVNVDLKAGDRIGFFIVPDGFSQKNMAKLLADEKAAFKFVDAKGQPGNVNAGSELKLVHVNEKGVETIVKSTYGNSVFHSFGGAEGGLNGDGFQHVKAEVDVVTGSLKIGFEDLWKGGDKDFDDSVFRFDIGQTNAALLPKEGTGAAKSSDNDTIYGGIGDDKLFGMAGDDVVYGDDGDDQIWGNSGSDKLYGGEGQDKLYGGSGDDVLDGGDGDDYLEGNSGDDVVYGGDGNDELHGNSGNDVLVGGNGDDNVDGGSGDDVVVAGAGNDFYDGGSGFDTLDYSKAGSAVDIDISKGTAVSKEGMDTFRSFEAVIGSGFDDSIKGSKRDDVIMGGDGDDVIRGMGGSDTLTGGAGNDRFVWSAKDIVDPETGTHLGVDRITDLEVGDSIDLKEILKSHKSADLSDVVKVSDTNTGALVSVKIGDDFHDVVVVDNYSAADLLESGMILA